jgi:TRAP-type C4-dicarboxylate transport system permease small subunit
MWALNLQGRHVDRLIGTAGQPDMGKLLIVASLLGLFALAVWVAYRQWTLAAVDMPGWGWAMLLIGGGLLLMIGFGLMALMFYSSRHGYDEGAHQAGRATDNKE